MALPLVRAHVRIKADHVADAQHVDPNNANPSRLSRLPNSMRFDSRQELLALNIGTPTWKEWRSHIQAEAIGERLDFDDLSTFDTTNDPNNVLGKRWLCKDGSSLFVVKAASASHLYR